ncbi:MAG TPA: cupredoxin family copper-binding protein, partial [Thermomicrobiales bacterium]|nr:cupredoxin family copper-binding protein [Thermomicrobiales bacterium]
ASCRGCALAGTGRCSRRAFVGRAAILGLAAPALAAVLSACGAGAAPPAATATMTAMPGMDMSPTAGAPAATAAAAGVPGGSPAAGVSPAAGGPRVTIDNFNFVPNTLTVPVGTTVTWTNHDDIVHTVTSKDQVFNSGALDTNDSFTYTFTKPGTYPYFCAIHPIMTAQVVVQ